MSQAHNPYPDLDDARYAELVNAQHTKSSFSNGNGGCVTFAVIGDHVSVQDDKLDDSTRKALTQVYTREEIAAFIAGAKAGDFDHLLSEP